jgi:hypothetical protein
MQLADNRPAGVDEIDPADTDRVPDDVTAPGAGNFGGAL